MNSPLSGAAVLVTRPEGQAGALAELVRQAGGEAVLFPALAIEPLANVALPEGDISRFDLVVFVSPNAARLGLPQIEKAGGLGPTTRIAAIGPATVAGLRKRGLRSVISPKAGYDSEALLAELAATPPARVLIVRGEGGRELLGETLRARGAFVAYLECYRRVRPAGDMRAVMARPASVRVQACLATSSNIVENLVQMAGTAGISWLRGLPLFVSHPRVATTAFSQGIRTVFVSGNGDEALVAGLATWFARTRLPAR